MVKSPSGNIAESSIALFFFPRTAGQVGITISAKGSFTVQLLHGSGIASSSGPGTQPVGHSSSPDASTLTSWHSSGQETSVIATHLQPGAQIFGSDAGFKPGGE